MEHNFEYKYSSELFDSYFCSNCGMKMMTWAKKASEDFISKDDKYYFNAQKEIIFKLPNCNEYLMSEILK